LSVYFSRDGTRLDQRLVASFLEGWDGTGPVACLHFSRNGAGLDQRLVSSFLEGWDVTGLLFVLSVGFHVDQKQFSCFGRSGNFAG